VRLIHWIANGDRPLVTVILLLIAGWFALLGVQDMRRVDRGGNYCNPYRVVKCDSTEVWCGDGRHKVKP
jgi:hypothetical protein